MEKMGYSTCDTDCKALGTLTTRRWSKDFLTISLYMMERGGTRFEPPKVKKIDFD